MAKQLKLTAAEFERHASAFASYSSVWHWHPSTTSSSSAAAAVTSGRIGHRPGYLRRDDLEFPVAPTDADVDVSSEQASKDASDGQDEPSILRPTAADALEDDEDDIDVLQPTKATDIDNVPDRNVVRLTCSIVYSSSYTSPALFFSGFNADGSTIDLDSIRNVVHPTMRPSVERDPFGIVSLEEHPVTGMPSFFVHPCRTPEVLALLRHESNPSQSTSSTTTPVRLPLLASFLSVYGPLLRIPSTDWLTLEKHHAATP